MTFYIEPLIPIPFDSINTLRVSCREGDRQKILIHQVLNGSVIVRGRQEGLSCIPHLPYPREDLEGVLQKDFLPSLKILRKDWVNTYRDKWTQDRVHQKI